MEQALVTQLCKLILQRSPKFYSDTSEGRAVSTLSLSLSQVGRCMAARKATPEWVLRNWLTAYQTSSLDCYSEKPTATDETKDRPDSEATPLNIAFILQLHRASEWPTTTSSSSGGGGGEDGNTDGDECLREGRLCRIHSPKSACGRRFYRWCRPE